jgi:hypothetical protein
MKKTKRTKITIERERLLVVASRRIERKGWCEACNAEVRMVGSEEAAAITGLGQRSIFRLIEAGQLHFSENPHGALSICLNSLLEQMSAGESRALKQVEDDHC